LEFVNLALYKGFSWVECILLNFDALRFQKMHPPHAGVSFSRQFNHLDSKPRNSVCEKRRFRWRTEQRCSTPAYPGAPAGRGPLASRLACFARNYNFEVTWKSGHLWPRRCVHFWKRASARRP